jgi:hypothetical protein
VLPDADLAIDWRDAAPYALLIEADRTIFAWEWLRRDPSYREAARAASEGGEGVTPDQFGLHAFEMPDRAAPHARPIWRMEAHPFVLCASALAAGPSSDTFELSCRGSLATIVQEAGAEHLLLSDGLRVVRLDISAGTLLRGPVQLHYALTGLQLVEKPLLTLRRLVALWRTGGFSRSLHVREPRARRWILALRAYDGVAAGADQREIASMLLSAVAGEPRWRSNAPSIRSQVQRLTRMARLMPAGGYRALLD